MSRKTVRDAPGSANHRKTVRPEPTGSPEPARLAAMPNYVADLKQRKDTLKSSEECARCTRQG